MPRRFRGPVLGLVALLTAAVASLRSAYVLAFAHHYANFVAVGRSTVKIIILAGYAAAVFVVAMLPALFPVQRARKLFVAALYVALCLSLLSTAGMAALIAKLGVPLSTTFYAVNAQEFSFGHLVHSHLFRPVGYLLKSLFHVEVGTSWFDVLRYFLHIPAPLLIGFYVLTGLFMVWLVVTSLAFAQHQKGMALKLLCIVAGVAVIKSLIDGAFLDASALLGVVTLGILTRERFLIILPLPFLLMDYFLWFTPTYIPQIAATAMLLGALWLFHAAGSHKGGLRVLSSIGGAALIATFVWYGAHVSFFGADDAVAGIAPQTPLIPANQEVHFLPQGSRTAVVATTTQAISPADFVREHDVAYEDLKGSLRLPGLNCKPGAPMRFLNAVWVFTPQGEAKNDLSGPGFTGTYHGSYYIMRMDSCTPDILPSLAFATKAAFPDVPVVLIGFSR